MQVTQTKLEADRRHLDWIFIAKGIGVFFVVVGHFEPDFSPDYWVEVINIGYSFHMPLFFLLSGFLYDRSKYSYFDLIGRKARRLLWPFVSIAIVSFLIKLASGYVVDLDHPIGINNIFVLLTDPGNSYMPLLWFVHTLFLIFALYPLVRKFMKSWQIFLLLFVLNTVLGDNSLFFVGKALANMPFFIFGILLREGSGLMQHAIGAGWRRMLIPFVAFSIAFTIDAMPNIPTYCVYLLTIALGISGSLFVINLSHVIAKMQNAKVMGVLSGIGYYSMTIYLFHTFFESIVRIGFIQILESVWIPFEPIALLAVMSGIIFPLLLEKEVLRKHAIARRFILGLS